MMGGRGGWLGFEVGEDTGGGEVAGDEAADMTVDMFRREWYSRGGWSGWARSRARSQRQARRGGQASANVC